MDDNKIEKLNSLFEKLVKSVNHLNKEVNAEYNHGNGFYDENSQKDFIEYFAPMIEDVNDKYYSIIKSFEYKPVKS